jgi:hypothetical protein
LIFGNKKFKLNLEIDLEFLELEKIIFSVTVEVESIEEQNCSLSNPEVQLRI